MLARAFASAVLKRAAQASAGDAGLAVRTFRAPSQQLAGLALKQGLAAAAPAAGLGGAASAGSAGLQSLKTAIGSIKTSALPHLSFASAGLAFGVAAALAVPQTAAAEPVLVHKAESVKPSAADSTADDSQADGGAVAAGASLDAPSESPSESPSEPAPLWAELGEQIVWFAASAVFFGLLTASGPTVAHFACLFVWAKLHQAILDHMRERGQDYLPEHSVQFTALL